jgi:hypothetical protein
LTLICRVPPQNSNTQASQSIKQAQEKASTALVASLSANFALCTASGVSMAKVFQIINNLQLITIMPLVKVSTPPQFISFCQTLQDFANVNIIPEEFSVKGIKDSIVAKE